MHISIYVCFTVDLQSFAGGFHFRISEKKCKFCIYKYHRSEKSILIIGCIYFKVVLIISGNLSFLNWLTIVPSLACFDDASLSWLFSGKPDSVKDQVLKIQHSPEGCLLYTSDAADDMQCVDLGGRRIIKKCIW